MQKENAGNGRRTVAVSQIKVGAVLSYLTSAVSLLLGVLYTPWMISVIGRDDYGLYTLAISITSVFLMDFGIGAGVTRYLSVYYARGERDKAGHFLGMVYRLYLGLAAAVAVALIAVYFFVDRIYLALSPGQLEVFKGLYVVVAFYSVASVPFMSQNNVLIANERFIALRVCGLAQKLLVTALTVAALLMGLGVFSLVLVNAVGNLLFIAIKAALIRVKTRARADWGPFDAGLAGEFARFSGWVAVGQACGQCNYGLMPSVLGAVSSAAQITVFGLASQLESYVYMVGDALGAMFMPRVARILEGRDPERELLALMVKAGRIQVYVIGLIYTGFACFGGAFVSLWLGDGYEDVWAGTMLILLPSMVSLPQQVGTTALTATNNVRCNAYASMAMAAVCLSAGFALAPRFGALGACAAVMCGLLVNRAVANYFYSKRLGLDVAAFFRGAYLRWLPVAAALVLLGFAVQMCLPCASWALLFAEACLYGAVYLLACWLLVFDDYEKDLLRGPMRRLRGMAAARRGR